MGETLAAAEPAPEQLAAAGPAGALKLAAAELAGVPKVAKLAKVVKVLEVPGLGHLANLKAVQGRRRWTPEHQVLAARLLSRQSMMMTQASTASRRSSARLSPTEVKVLAGAGSARQLVFRSLLRCARFGRFDKTRRT